jgi:hypothetical protein
VTMRALQLRNLQCFAADRTICYYFISHFEIPSFNLN